MTRVVAEVNAGSDGGEERPDARARLLAAAVASFSTRGFHGTTTRDIAAGAGMSPAALYVHHRSKEELLHVIAREGHARTLALCEAAVAAAPTPAAQLERLVRDFVVHHATNHTTARIINYELAALTPEHREEIEAQRSAIQALVRDLVARGVAAGELHTDDPMMTAAAVLSLGVDVARWYDESGWTPTALADHYVALVRRMLLT